MGLKLLKLTDLGNKTRMETHISYKMHVIYSFEDLKKLRVMIWYFGSQDVPVLWPYQCYSEACYGDPHHLVVRTTFVVQFLVSF